MNTETARAILRQLADGIDPVTGRQFPPDSPYQQADVVRALYAAVEVMESRSTARKPSEPAKPRVVDPNRPKAGAAWTQEEEDAVVAAFKKGVPFAEIAATHGRTRGAVTARLVKLGLIKDDGRRFGQGNAPAPTEPAQQEPPPDCPF